MKSKDEGFWELGIFGLSWDFLGYGGRQRLMLHVAWVDQCIYSSLFFIYDTIYVASRPGV